jgi:hypothetical protein
LPPPGQRNAAAIPSIPTIATCSRKVLDRFDGHGASLSVNFGPSSNSVSTTSLRPNNEIPISPRTKRTVPATMSQCGYARNKAKAFVIFASFCLKMTGGVYGPLPARHDNPLKVLAFPALATAFAFLQGFGAGNVSRRRAPLHAGGSITSHSKATPSGSFSANHVSAASAFAKPLR